MSASTRSRKGLIAVIFLVALFFVMLMSFALFLVKGVGLSSSSKKGFGKSGDSVIGVIEVKDVIMDSKKIIDNLQEALDDDSVKGIILRVDSPGGAVGPTQEIYDEIVRIDAIKPVWASFGSMAASGGYYVGSACRKIYANAGTLTGSIGVIMHFMDLSQLYEWAKVKEQIIKAGKYKDIGSPSRQMTEEESALLRNVLSGVHEQFKRDILKRRKMIKKDSLDELAQGQIFSGEQAKALGLIDEIGGMWTMARVMAKELKIKGEPELLEIKDKKPFSIRDLFDEAESMYGQAKWGISSGPIPLFMGKW